VAWIGLAAAPWMMLRHRLPRRVGGKCVLNASANAPSRDGADCACSTAALAVHPPRRPRRRLQSTVTATPSYPADPPTTKTASKSPFGAGRPSGPSGSRAGPRGSLPPPPETDGQRARSMALVSEGLEGLIPRATELIKLGGSVFLAFAPFIVAISLTFSGLYLVFGEHLLHGGTSRSGPPAYVDPATLLSEPTVDPYIPYQ
jgi:hypothetical protein